MPRERLFWGEQVITWPIPRGLTRFQSYGLWNSLGVYDRAGQLLEVVPAHDGDFFPESPLNYIELLRAAVCQSRERSAILWPIRVDIDVTQNCTDHCIFCYSRPYAAEALYRNAEISAAQFETLLKELAEGGTKSIRFTGGGEPLLHPEIKQMLPLPSQHGLCSTVITNGRLLDAEMSELLVAHSDLIRVSINAAQNHTYQLLHRPQVKGNDLPRLCQQIKNMTQLRERRRPGQKKPLIWATFLLVPENVNEIYTVTQIMKECGVDSISFRPVYHKRVNSFSEEAIGRLRHQLELALSLHSPPDFQVFVPKRDVQTVWELSPKRFFSRCLSCQVRTIIEATHQGPMIKLCGLNRGIHGRGLGVPGESLGILDGTTRFATLWQRQHHVTPAVFAQRPQNCHEHCIDISANVTFDRVWKVLAEHSEAVFQQNWTPGLR